MQSWKKWNQRVEPRVGKNINNITVETWCNKVPRDLGVRNIRVLFYTFCHSRGEFFSYSKFSLFIWGLLCIRGSLYSQPWQKYSRGKRIKKYMQLNFWKQCQTVLKQLTNKIFIWHDFFFIILYITLLLYFDLHVSFCYEFLKNQNQGMETKKSYFKIKLVIRKKDGRD